MVDRRAVSSVIGVVLILGLSLATVTTIMVVGTTILDDAQSDVRTAQLENSMAQFASKASLVALGESDGQSVTLGGLGNGELAVRPEAGRVTVTYHPNNNTSEVLANESFGALVYTADDTEIAYQGGGVWKSHGSGSTMLSPPEYHYKVHTLTFPIIRVVGVEGTGRSGVGHITDGGTAESIYPNETYENPLEEGTVTVELQSDYHHAWHRFFDRRTDGAVVHDPDNRTVRVDLTVLFESAYDRPVAVTSSGGIDMHGPGDVPEEWADGASGYPSATNPVESAIEDCDGTGNCETFDGSGEYDNNTTYYSNTSVDLDDTVTFDTTEGDITVVIDGHFDIGDEDVEVVGDNNVTIFLADGIDVSGNSEINENGSTSASQFRMYVHSQADPAANNDYTIDIGPATITGIIYAPNSDARVHGNVDFTGSLIVESVVINGGGATDIKYDDSLSELELGIENQHSEIKFLHVTDNRIEIDLSR